MMRLICQRGPAGIALLIARRRRDDAPGRERQAAALPESAHEAAQGRALAGASASYSADAVVRGDRCSIACHHGNCRPEAPQGSYSRVDSDLCATPNVSTAAARTDAVALARDLKQGAAMPGWNWTGWFVVIMDQHGHKVDGVSIVDV